MSNRHPVDRDRPVNRNLTPALIARHRALTTSIPPFERARFLTNADLAARITRAGGDTYTWFRTALDADDSVAVAAIIEGAASTRTSGYVI